jgi:hypothetical protein
MNTGLRYSILLCASLLATQVIATDMSGWSDKTVCRLVKSGGLQEHIDEAAVRGMSCETPVVVKKPSSAVIDSPTDASELILDAKVRKPFKASNCKDYFYNNLRLNSKSDCFVLAKLDHPYEVPVHHGAKNIWNTMMMLDAQPTTTGGMSLNAYTYDQTVKTGTNSDARPKTHLVSVVLNDLLLLEGGLTVPAKEWELALVPRRLSFVDIDVDGDIELLLLANQEDGRLRSSSWKDKNYIFSPSDNTLKSFGTPQFSHDLMISDFDQDGHVEVLDHYYGVPGKRGGVEHCNLKTGKCKHS